MFNVSPLIENEKKLLAEIAKTQALWEEHIRCLKATGMPHFVTDVGVMVAESIQEQLTQQSLMLLGNIRHLKGLGYNDNEPGGDSLSSSD